MKNLILSILAVLTGLTTPLYAYSGATDTALFDAGGCHRCECAELIWQEQPSWPMSDAEYESMVEHAKIHAYMDPDSASASLKEIILAARRIVIGSQSWVADEFEGEIINTDGTSERVPKFHELFPADWEPPVYDTENWNIPVYDEIETESGIVLIPRAQ